ncbi:trichohyalin isoform X2 [Cottoperca gobio]|uniref:Trichohyalin isoform X2 n=1 Tax=Cottoperca gobio TaxID=56716 RepID=A0A6J2Q8N5_COTGO|nr:trichohyalin-like isoform X2 [Cottoperca gobio]
MMAAQVEVQTGEVGRTLVGGRLHLSPLTDSSNKSLIEIPSINQSHIISPEPNKPVPGPKPRLTPKPFAVERNATIRPILAPKPQAKPRPESTRLAGYKSELPCNPTPQQPVAPGKPRPVSTNPNRPASTSFKTSNKLNTGQTTKPVAQPFKPAPPLDPADPSKPIPPVTAARRKSSSLVYSNSLKQLLAAEWSGTTKIEDEKDLMTSSKSEAAITRTKSMGYLVQVGQEEEEKQKANPEAAVVMRAQSRGSRPRPVSAIFIDSPTNTESPVPAPRWARRPLSADLTSKFESIGLSLHRKSSKENTKENTPEEQALPQKREQEKTPKSATQQSTDVVAQPAVLDQSNKKTEEMTVKETDEDKRAVSIKSRISLLLDSSSSPGAGVTGQGSDPHSPVQPVPETEPPVGVKQLIKQLTEDTTPTQSLVAKPPLKPRPLPLDLTKRFSSERSLDFGSVSLSEATDRHDISRDPQRRIEESAITPSDQRTFEDLKDAQEQLIKASTPEGPETGQTFAATFKESGPSSDVQTVRASLFEHVVERHSVLMVEEDKPANKAEDSLSSPSFRRGNGQEEGTLVTATYKEPVSPSSPLRVLHAFDTVQAVEESRAVSENIPSALWEDKAMTLRSRRSEGSRPVAERTGPAQGEAAFAERSEQQPRILRVGALPKWSHTGLEQEASVEIGMQKESQREGQVAVEQDRQREAEQEEVAAAPKRLKTEEQPKPRATYFALTGQIQEPVSPVDAGAYTGDMPFDDFSLRSAPGSSQGKVLPIRRNPSLDEAFVNNSRDQVEELMKRSHMSHKDIRPVSDGQMADEMMEVEKKRELKKETERHMAKMKALERERRRQLEMEKEAHLEFARMKERDMQREFEKQRQKAFEKEKQDFEEKQRALERLELEQEQKLQELEKARLVEMEKERKRQLEKEKRREFDRQRKLEREKLRELERERQREQERQRQREEKRQRELDKERQLLEIQKEKQKMEEVERIKEQERLLLLEFGKQKQKEKERQQIMELEIQRLAEKMEREQAEKIKQMALEQEMLRMKDLEKERERRREMEKERQKEIEREKQREIQRDLERDRQRQLDIERQELENQRLRQREMEKEKLRKEELERFKEMEKRQLLEFEKQKQAERERQQIFEHEKRRLRERMEREEAEKMRHIAKQQEAERQRLKERQKKEEQERARLESAHLRPKVVDLDSVLRNASFSKASPQRSDLATRWKEPSPRSEESYKPPILDIDSFTSQAQLSPSKDLFPVSGIQSVDAAFGARLQPTPDVDVSWRMPPQTSAGFTSPVWTTSLQDPWELRPVEMSVDKPVAEPKKHANKLSLEQLLLRQEERLLAPQRNWSAGQEETLNLAPLPRTEAKGGGSPGGVSSSAPAEQIWLPRQPQPQPQPQGGRIDVRTHRRSQGAQELNRMRSRSVSRRSAPSSSAVETSLSRMRSRSAHREEDHIRWLQQKQSVSGEEEDSGTPARDSDSQYGTWETGLRTDDSHSPATPSSESNLSPSPRKPTPLHTPGDQASPFDTDTPDSLPPSSESQPLPFPDTPTALLDTSALRSRAHLVKKRAPRTRPSKAGLQTAALSEAEGGTTEDWLYRDSTGEHQRQEAKLCIGCIPSEVLLL